MFSFIALAMILGTGDRETAGPPSPRWFNHLRMPAHGSAHKGMLYGYFDDAWVYPGPDGRHDWRRIHIDAIPLDKPAWANWKSYQFLKARDNLNFGTTSHLILFGLSSARPDTS